MFRCFFPINSHKIWIILVNIHLLSVTWTAEEDQCRKHVFVTLVFLCLPQVNNFVNTGLLIAWLVKHKVIIIYFFSNSEIFFCFIACNNKCTVPNISQIQICWKTLQVQFEKSRLFTQISHTFPSNFWFVVCNCVCTV